MKRVATAAVCVFLAAACADQGPLSPVQAPSNASILPGDAIVTNSNDAGPGSLREAVAQANSDANIHVIAFGPSVSTIALQSPITYTGAQALTINGNHATLDAANAGGSALVANGGGDLTLIGFGVKNAPSHGVHVELPAVAVGTITVRLEGLLISGNAGHGVLVNDQVDPSTADGVQPDDRGSAASVAVFVTDTRFIHNGYSVSDRDGLRVNEGGIGDLIFTLRNSRAEENAADGIEIDERGAGNVVLDVEGAEFTRNGPFDPTDFDDGFDIDEYNDGSISGSVRRTTSSHNFEEGLDFNENNNGDLRVDLTDVEANFNGEEGIDYEEDDDFGNSGDLVATMTRVTAHGNAAGDGGLKIREKQAGNLSVTVDGAITSQNSTTGLYVRESSGGNSNVVLANVISNGNAVGAGAGDGITLLESGSGALTASVTGATLSANGGVGVFGDEAGGTVALTNVRGSANVGGATGGAATFTIVP